jgi:HEPN domain-containing protein
MKPVTKDWVNLAEASYTAAKHFARSHKALSRSLCFHSREAVRKYLIALLEETDVPVNRASSLTGLASPLFTRLPNLSAAESELLQLNRFDGRVLYPGHVATRADARAALKACRTIRAEVRHSLGLPKR